jgi:hypothetical protein
MRRWLPCSDPRGHVTLPAHGGGWRRRPMRRFRQLLRGDRGAVGYLIPADLARNPSGHVSARTFPGAGPERPSVGLDLPRRTWTTSTTRPCAPPSRPLRGALRMSRLSPDEVCSPDAVCAPCSSRRGKSWRGNTRSASDMRFHIGRWWPLFGTRRPCRQRPSLCRKPTRAALLRSPFNRSTTYTGPAERNARRRDNAKSDALVAPAAHPQAHRTARPPIRRSSRAPRSAAAAGRPVLEVGGGDLHPRCGRRMGNAWIRARGPFGGDRCGQRRARRLGGGAGREARSPG